MNQPRYHIDVIESASDADVFDFYQDPSMLASVAAQHIPKNIQQAHREKQRLRHIGYEGSGLYWGLFLEGKLIGVMGLHSWDYQKKTIEVSYEIHRQYRGRGLATRCLTYLCHFAFEHFEVESILCKTLASNSASQKVALKAGFSLSAVYEHDILFNGQWHGRCIYRCDQARMLKL